MTFRDRLSLALRNLRQSRLRTVLTALGVAIGIASLAGMVSLGVGIEDQVIGRLTKSGVFDNITVTAGRSAGPRLGLPGGRGRAGRGQAPASSEPPPALDDEAVAKFAALPNVRDAYPQLRVPVSYRYEGRNNAALALASRSRRAAKARSSRWRTAPFSKMRQVQPCCSRSIWPSSSTRTTQALSSAGPSIFLMRNETRRLAERRSSSRAYE